MKAAASGLPCTAGHVLSSLPPVPTHLHPQMLPTTPALQSHRLLLQALLLDPQFMAYVDEVERAWIEVEQELEGELVQLEGAE